jgi:hypothetical protein
MIPCSIRKSSVISDAPRLAVAFFASTFVADIRFADTAFVNPFFANPARFCGFFIPSPRSFLPQDQQCIINDTSVVPESHNATTNHHNSTTIPGRFAPQIDNHLAQTSG